MHRTQNFQIMLHFNIMSGPKYKMLKCNMYNLNISQIVRHKFYRRCFLYMITRFTRNVLI